MQIDTGVLFPLLSGGVDVEKITGGNYAKNF